VAIGSHGCAHILVYVDRRDLQFDFHRHGGPYCAGTTTVLALIVTGQMLGSLVFDHFGPFGVPQHPASLTRLAGTLPDPRSGLYPHLAW
jgi:hypothetical protein